MIAKMSKLTLLVYHKEYVDFLQRLRKVGVVHVVEKNSGAVEDPELEKQLQLSARYARAIKKFESLAKETAAAGNITDTKNGTPRFRRIPFPVIQSGPFSGAYSPSITASIRMPAMMTVMNAYCFLLSFSYGTNAFICKNLLSCDTYILSHFLRFATVFLYFFKKIYNFSKNAQFC